MTLKDQLRSNFPKTINKTAPIFAALVVNDSGTAAFEYELNFLKSFMQEWVSSYNVYEQSGAMLERTIDFFSFFERFTNETDESLKKRFSSVFVRNHDLVWGTPFDVKDVMRQYFPSANVFLVENTNDTESENLMLNGDFTDSSDNWTLSGGSALSPDARFSKSYGLSLETSGTAVQSFTVSNLTDTTYFLHFFMKGKLKIRIKNNENKYWNNLTKTWSSTSSYTEFTSEDWDNKSLYFILNSDITEFDVEISGNGEQISYIDYIRLFEKKSYPSFTIIVQFTGDSSQDALKLAPGTSDPDAEISDYSKYNYFDQSFIVGSETSYSADIYMDILNIIRTQGVKAYLEVITRDN